ncbi:hypothetical protein [Streptomyces sp. NPDC049813]|uniref:hypothetical protein n=1 Tax=Streptomyces sp. NPDC049813 TaxID=3365597 RepID=UPI003789083E
MRQIPALLFVLHVVCAVCKAQVTRLELARPGAHPASWYGWGAEERQAYGQVRDTAAWWLIVDADGAANGLGENLGDTEARSVQAAFEYPRSYARIHAAGLKGDAGFCPECDVAYCVRHWRGTGAGAPDKCPRGHGR